MVWICGDGTVGSGSGIDRSGGGAVPEAVAQCVDGILEDVGEHLAHELLVCEEHHPLVLQADVHPASQSLDFRHKRLEHIVQRMDLRHRYAGQGPVAVDEAEQATGRLPDDLYPLTDTALPGHAQQGIAERDDRSDRIEHLVGDDARHLLPLGILLRAGLGCIKTYIRTGV